MNHYYCSNGERVTQININYRRKLAYEKCIDSGFKFFNGVAVCDGCERKLTGSFAHIVPQARCKQLRKTELIWDQTNFFPACFDCNSIAENVSSESITKLRNFEYIKEYLRVHDVERFNKLKI